jgi:palmitoyltransferase
MTTVPPSSTPPKPTKWIGFRESYRIKSEERRNREGPQPWIVRKLLIGIVFGLVGYSYYVFVERLCVPMIRKDGGAFGTFGTGGRAIGEDVFLKIF